MPSDKCECNLPRINELLVMNHILSSNETSHCIQWAKSFFLSSTDFFTSFIESFRSAEWKMKSEVAKSIAGLIINHLRKDAYEICLNLNSPLVIIMKTFKWKSCNIFYIRKLFSTPFIFTSNIYACFSSFPHFWRMQKATRIHFSASSLCRYRIMESATVFGWTPL